MKRMSEEEKKSPEVEEPLLPEEEPETEAKEEAPKSKKELKEQKKADAAIRELEKKNAELIEKVSAAEDSRLRLAAEYDNYRRRTQKEREKIYNDAFADAILGILPIIDNLDRALSFGESEESRKGMEMIIKAANDALEKMGVKEIEALGKTFDPALHNAVMHTADETKGEGEITAVLQKGYTLGDKVIRFAMVSVAN